MKRQQYTKREIISLCAIIAILAISATVQTTDWPQWRGPFFNGSTDEINLPDSWGETENVAWVSPLPDASGDLVGFDYNGNKLWSRNIEAEYGNLALQFGYSFSPMLYGNKLYVIVIRRNKPYRPPQAEEPLDSFVMALNPETGKTIWKQQRTTSAFDEGMETYITPVPFIRGGRMEILNTSGDFVTAHDVGGNEFKIIFETKTDETPIQSSISVADGHLFIRTAKNLYCIGK